MLSRATLARTVELMPFRRPIEGPPRLNYDVLFNVMYHAAQHAPPDGRAIVSRMMRTCRVLYSEGAKTILQLNAHFPLPSNVGSFSLFLLAENGARLPLVKTLSISPWDGHAGSAVVQMLPRMPALTELSLQHKPDFGEWTPNFIQFFTNFTSLRCLLLNDPDTSTIHMVACMRSSLSTLIISHGIPSTLPSQPLASSSLSSLETLYFHDVELPPVLSWWLKRCPNLKSIHVNSKASPDAARTLRQANKAAIRTAAGWPSLVGAIGSIADIYSLGLSHTLDVVTVAFITSPPEELEMLREVLCDTVSETLCIQLCLPGCAPGWAAYLEEAFAPGGVFGRALKGPGTGRLRALSITLGFAVGFQTSALGALVCVYASDLPSLLLKSMVS